MLQALKRNNEASPPTPCVVHNEKGRAKEVAQLKEWLKRGTMEVFTVNTLLTPALAGLLLDVNSENRTIVWTGSTRSVKAYAEAMARGEWRLNGETISISSCGRLNDGQHRCLAVVEAETAIPVSIMFGVERDTRHTVNQGIARSPGHILAMRGEANTNQLACALQFLWCLDSGVSLHWRPSMDQMLEALENHPEIRAAIAATRALWGHYRLSAGYISGAYYLSRQDNTFNAEQFVEAVSTGLNIKNVNSPVSRLRRQYEEHSAKRKPLGRIEQAALYIKAYNNFVKGRTGAILWRNIGPAAEAFPVVGG